MTTYWCKFLDAGGNVFGGEVLDEADDTAVIARARVIFASGIAADYDIWDGKRLVYRVRRQKEVMAPSFAR
jgi:hypothetical protein